MSDEEGDEGEIVEGSANLSTSSSIAASGTVIKTSRSIGNQTWSVEFGEYELKSESEAHRRQQERDQLKHDLEQTAKDNEARRLREEKDSEVRRTQEKVVFWVVVGLVIVGLLGGCGIAVWSEDSSTRQWAQNIVTTLFGGVIGGLAGYFTGKIGN